MTAPGSERRDPLGRVPGYNSVVTSNDQPSRAMARCAIALAADAAAVLLFVVLGRGSHDEGTGVGSVLNVAAPFLIGLAVGWLATSGPRRRPFAIASGVQVWVATVVIGVVLRWFAWDRGTALSFVIVTAVFLGFFIVGWRVVAAGATRPRSAVRSSRPPLEAER